MITGNTGAYAYNFCRRGTPFQHPLTGKTPAELNEDVPMTRASTYADIRSFYAAELSRDPSRLTYNDDYANFLSKLREMSNDNILPNEIHSCHPSILFHYNNYNACRLRRCRISW